MSVFGGTSTTSDFSTGNLTVISGMGAPTDATGAVGDFYVDKISKTLYGPKGGASDTFYGSSIRAHQDTSSGTTALTNQALGTRMTIVSTVGARAMALRFYKTPGGVAGSTRQLRLYYPGSTLLASATTPSETTGGWQEATLASPALLPSSAAIIVAYDWPETTNISYTIAGSSTTAPAVITYGGSQYGGALGGFPASTGSSGLMSDVVLQVPITGKWPIALISAP